VATLVPALMETLHGFCRTHRVQNDELYAALGFLGRTAAADEMILLSDVLWVSVLVDELTHGASGGEAESNVPGPLYRPGAPLRTRLCRGPEDGEPFHVTVEAVDATTQSPLGGVEVDVWQPDGRGKYDVQDPTQPPGNLRGRANTGADGRVAFDTVYPGAYEVPKDGPVGELLKALGRPAFRPAHIHFKLSCAGYKPVTTIAYFADDPHLRTDVIRSVKPSQVNPVARDGGRLSAELRFPLRAL